MACPHREGAWARSVARPCRAADGELTPPRRSAIEARLPPGRERPGRGPRSGRAASNAGPRARVLSRAITTALLALPLLLALPPPASAAGPTITTRAELFVDSTTSQPLFLLGANYEGPADRAWRMWEDTRFDPLLIAADF